MGQTPMTVVAHRIPRARRDFRPHRKHRPIFFAASALECVTQRGAIDPATHERWEKIAREIWRGLSERETIAVRDLLMDYAAAEDEAPLVAETLAFLDGR
ncbi:MAG: hypothetical protein ACJ780_24750 [Solirubrobacteraceae bacterium]